MKIFLHILIFLFLISCSNSPSNRDDSSNIVIFPKNEVTKRIDTQESVEYQRAFVKPDSSYVKYWCSSEILLNTEKNIDKLNLVLVADFLATFHESCNNNVEYSEWSNELLFQVINKKPGRFLELLMKNTSLSRDFIINELAHPINDGINIDATIVKIRDLEEPVSDYWKFKIIESLNLAKEKK